MCVAGDFPSRSWLVDQIQTYIYIYTVSMMYTKWNDIQIYHDISIYIDISYPFISHRYTDIHQILNIMDTVHRYTHDGSKRCWYIDSLMLTLIGGFC